MERSYPGAAVKTAQSNVERGFTALKGYPFDHRGLYTSYAVEKLALDKLEAVRDAVGPEVEVIVECHGRLTPA